MKSDGTHQMTMVTNTGKGGVKTYSMRCNDCSKTSRELSGDSGKATIENSIKSHATSTQTEAEIRRRNEGTGR